MPVVDDIRRVAAKIACAAPPGPGACRGWGYRHLEAIRRHCLGPWLYKSLRMHPSAGLSSALEESLHEDYRASAVTCMSGEVFLKRLLDRFNARQIPVLLLKGAYLGTFVYKDPALRPMSDVDLLVRPEDFDRSRQELVELGYGFEQGRDEEYSRLWELPVVYTKQGHRSHIVDLHSSLRSMDYYLFPSSALWNDAVSGELHGRKVFYLSPEMNFIHLCVHNLNHADLLRDWIDLLLFLGTVGPDWNRLLERGRLVGALRPLFWIFCDLKAHWNFSPPSPVTSQLASYVPHRLEDRVIRHRFRYGWRLYARLKSLDGWGSRLRYLRLKLVPWVPDGSACHELPWWSYLRDRLGLFLHFWKR
ncbi:MAG TPA: nucleotidyltransferase family protein [Desulfomonilaceae bacterium]|nr:nucleotidyltransferase family protein [Desulfomonilaceae bacterium]